MDFYLEPEFRLSVPSSSCIPAMSVARECQPFLLWVSTVGRALKDLSWGINWAGCMSELVILVGTKTPMKDYSFLKQTFLGAPPVHSPLHKVMTWKPPSNPNYTGWVTATTQSYPRLSYLPSQFSLPATCLKYDKHLWTKTACCSALFHYLVKYGSFLIWGAGQHWDATGKLKREHWL